MKVIEKLMTARVLVVDNNELVRALLKLDLGRFSDLELVGAAVNGQEAISLTRQLKPDVILMDLQMPVMDGLTASEYIKQEFPHIQIIAYTSLQDPQVEVMVKATPIDQFCYKDARIEEVVDLIRECRRQQLKH